MSLALPAVKYMLQTHLRALAHRFLRWMNCVITWIQSERILESVLFLFVLDFSTFLSFHSLLSSLSLIIYYVGPGVLGNSKITSLRSLGCERLTWTTTKNTKKENLAKTRAIFMWPCEKPWPGLREYWKWVWVQIPFLLQGIKVIAFVLALNGTDTEMTGDCHNVAWKPWAFYGSI